MQNKITIVVDGQEHYYLQGTRLETISKDFQNKFRFSILIAEVNGKLTELSEAININCHVKFFDCTSCIGNRIYEKGLIYILGLAIKELFGNDKDIVVENPVYKGIAIKTNFRLTDQRIIQIKEYMDNIVRQDLPIEKVVVEKNEAIEYFKSIDYFSQENALLYNVNSYVNLYRLKNSYDYYYTEMPISTKVFTNFELECINANTLVMMIPYIYSNGKIEKFTSVEKIFNVFKSNKEITDKLNIKTAADLNKLSSKGTVKDIVRISEMFQNNELLSIAETIYNQKDKLKLVLIAGPSSSGKTTTSRKLAMCLRGFGINPISLSIDNYFLEREETRKDKDGNYDYESIDAIDLKLFNKQMEDLLNNKEVIIPTYNFITGMKEYKKSIKMEDSDILIVEGLHGLNEKLTAKILKENKLKIYLSPLTELNIDNHNRISTNDNRLLRRIVRDNRTRGYGVVETIASWPLVRSGEEKYIFPYQSEADIIFNTSLIYEMGVLKTYVEPLLYSVPYDSEYYEEARRLLNLLRGFLSIPSDSVPEDSIFREFIGGSCFENK